MQCDIAVVGGGIAGSSAAILLARKGYSVILIDPHETVQRDFRCEKFNDEQTKTLQRMGLAEKLFPALTPLKDVWVARYGRLINRIDYPHFGFTYDEIVNALRNRIKSEFSGAVTLVHSKVKDVAKVANQQKLVSADGSEFNAKLVIIANGLNPGLQQSLGLRRKMISKSHCMAAGFDLMPEPGNAFAFDSLTYWGENPELKMAYCAYFKYSGGYRANMFGYWDKNSEELQRLRTSPLQGLERIMPRTDAVTGAFRVVGPIRVRPIDLYEIENPVLDGIVLIGDAFSTSCPGAGTGVGKALIDVEQLCEVHVPNWFDNEDFSAARIAEFYADPVKVASDESGISQAFQLRSLTLDKSSKAKAGRAARFLYHFTKGITKGVPFGERPQIPVHQSFNGQNSLMKS